MATDYALRLTRNGAYCGLIVCLANPDNSGIWYYNQGIAPPPSPLGDTRGTLEAIASSYLLVFGPPNSGRLDATVWNLNLATVKTGDKGQVSTPTSMYEWEYCSLDNSRLQQDCPGGVDSAELHLSKMHHA